MRGMRGGGGPAGSPGDQTLLYADLEDQYDDVDDLSHQTTDAADKKELRGQRDRIGDQLEELLAKIIDEDTAAYKDATAKVNAAAGKIQEALADIAKIKEAIAAVAGTIGAVAAVLAG